MMKKLKLTTIIFAICCVSFLAFLAFNPSHAYFQIFTDPVGINTAKVDLLFDKFTPNQEVEGDTTTRGNYTYGSFSGNIYTDAWGTIKNPYVMTGKNHVNNLFILQKSGYFEKKVDGNNEPRQSYFVVSNKDGTPIVIDCGGMNINPIGTPAKPFTGNIQGAPLTGDATYTAGAGTSATPYTVTQSTIANLNVIASENTPDIGFFGYLGFEGDLTITTTRTPDGLDKNGNAVYKNVESATMDGFAASVSNLLFADVTIKTKQTVGENWWSSAGTRTVTRITVDEKGNASQPVTATENIDSAHGDCAETHHIGIVAGHSEFATLTDISVYYSEDVMAFDLPQADNSGTSFYSISGILGTLKFVNPTLDSETGLLTSADSVSDPDLEITGGGGNKSGTMTGYMLAKNLFDAHDSKITAADKQEKYDTATMTDKNGNPLFTTVTMKEGQTYGGGYRNYYYFLDTIFTFAMSASVKADDKGAPAEDLTSRIQKDYVVRIWPIDETATWNNSTPPPITIASRLNASGENSWHYGPDESIANYVYKLEKVTGDLTVGESYVLAYIDENNNIYTLNLANTPVNNSIPALLMNKDIWNGTISVPNTDSSGNISYSTEPATSTDSTKYVFAGSDNDFCSYSFVYDDDAKTFIHGAYSLGITATADTGLGGYWGDYFGYPDLITSTAYNNVSDEDTSYWYTWKVTDKNNNGASTGNYKVVMNQVFTSGYREMWATRLHSKLVFNPVNTATTGNSSNINTFTIRTNRTEGSGASNEPDYTDDNTANDILLATDKQYFTIYKVTGVYATAETPVNMVPTVGTTVHTFNPSTDVLFFDKAEGGKNYYSVEPLESKKWNNGNGALLTELNHAVQMYQAPSTTTKVSMTNSWLGQLPFVGGIFSWLWDNNSGGIVHTPIGTNGKGYSIPIGTIAFDITKASAEDPSFINIVVAINPKLVKNSYVGLWHMEEGDWNETFNLTEYDQHFPLPISKTATSTADEQYVVNISNYTTPNGDGTFTDHEGDYATYLHGNTVLVGYSFRVTTPGIYIIASSDKMNVAYFSVDGAAGYGDDGTGAAPLGNIDFVYDNGQGTIITVDKKYTEEIHELSKETLATAYYPSYFYLRMYPNTPIPDSTSNGKYGPVPYDTIYIRRYIVAEYPTINGKVADRKRYIYLSATDPDTHLRGTSSFYQDIPSANYPTT